MLFFHGFPGSHLQGIFMHDVCKKMGLRVLAVDRPGYGYSKAQPGGTLTTLNVKLERAFARLKIDRFIVVGISGGNPGAVNAAGYFKERVISLGSICGLAPFVGGGATFSPFQQRGFKMASRVPEFVMRRIFDALLKTFDPNVKIQQIMARLDPIDQEVMKKPETREIMLRSIELARLQGSAGLVFDIKNYSRVWPVDWAQIQCPYFLWHGLKDRVLSPKMSRYMHELVPGSKLFTYPDEGHYSLPLTRTAEVLGVLQNVT